MIQKDAIDILKSIQDGLEETDFLSRCAFDMAIEALKERPSGEWKLRSPYEAWFEEYKCSNCNAYGWFNWHFCPNCGADMRKER